jgi:N4-gp56 family major capsid protein
MAGETTTTDLDTLVTTTHHVEPFYALRPQLIWDELAEMDHQPATHNGNTHNWNFYADMAAATTPLNEVTDVTPTTLSDTQRQVSVSEYGAAILATGLLRAVAYMQVNPIVWEIIGYNGGISVDTIARNRLESAAATLNGGVSNVVYSDAGLVASGTEAARNRIATTDRISANIIRYVTAKLRGTHVRPYGATYRGVIHPDAAYDLYAAAPNNNWVDPHIYVDTGAIYTNVVGTFGGVTWMESARASLFADAGNGAGAAGTIDVYGTYICGREAFGKMWTSMDDYGEQPVFVQRVRTDNLMRHNVVGWKHLVGYAVFRTEPIYRIEAASSIGVNT